MKRYLPIAVICLGFANLITMLIITFFINNMYINTLLIIIGIIIVLLAIAYGCEKIEKDTELFNKIINKIDNLLK
jgi:4-hydroxybenzoate polyprenyltransferase